jgi:hypothetical protein
MYVGRYGPGSTLEYSELIAGVVVRRGWRIGLRVTHIYVDSEASLEGGRAIWGLPKELAEFDWSEAGVTVTQGTRRICSVATSLKPGGIPLWAPVRAVGTGDWFAASIRSRVRLGWADWDVPRESPLAEIYGGERRITVQHGRLVARVAAPMGRPGG